MSILSHFITPLLSVRNTQRAHNNRLIHVLCSFFFSLAPTLATAQSIYPLRAVLTPQSPTANITVSNPTDRLLMIHLDWLDLAAQRNGTYLPAPPNQRLKASAAPYLILSPASFQLPPGAKKNILLRPKHPVNLQTTQEKRSHLLIQTRPIDSSLDQVSTTLPIDMITAISIPIILRNGVPRAKATINQAALERMPDGGLALNITLNRQGRNSLYGAVHVVMIIPETRPAQSHLDNVLINRENIAIYPETEQRSLLLELGRTVLPEGQLEIIYEGRGAYAGQTLARRIFKVGPPARENIASPTG